MRAKEIKVGHIYYVKFDPVKKGEFGKDHLAVVLKKNNNKITFIVIPLTSKETGLEQNKIKLEIKNLLPPHLRSKDTYAVYDQVRTVTAERFSRLTENGVTYDTCVPDKYMDVLYQKVVENLLDGILDENRKKEIKLKISNFCDSKV